MGKKNTQKKIDQLISNGLRHNIKTKSHHDPRKAQNFNLGLECTGQIKQLGYPLTLTDNNNTVETRWLSTNKLLLMYK